MLHAPFTPVRVPNDAQEGAMKRVESSIVFGMALICVGVLFLLQSLGVLGAVAGLLWALLFAAGGAAFLLVFATTPARWWALIPGFTLLSLGALIGLQELFPALAGPWGGALFLGGIGLGFFAVDLADRTRWWALIPGGVMVTLALMVILSEYWKGPELGWVLFLGLALTFGLVSFVPTPHGRMRWALFPAGVMLAMALLGMAFTGQVLGIVWPVVLILAGLLLATRAMRAPQRARIAQPDVPAVADDRLVSDSKPAALPLRDDAQPLARAVGDPALEPAHEEVL
jgi:hypothetical protein